MSTESTSQNFYFERTIVKKSTPPNIYHYTNTSTKFACSNNKPPPQDVGVFRLFFLFETGERWKTNKNESLSGKQARISPVKGGEKLLLSLYSDNTAVSWEFCKFWKATGWKCLSLVPPEYFLRITPTTPKQQLLFHGHAVNSTNMKEKKQVTSSTTNIHKIFVLVKNLPRRKRWKTCEGARLCIAALSKKLKYSKISIYICSLFTSNNAFKFWLISTYCNCLKRISKLLS